MIAVGAPRFVADEADMVIGPAVLFLAAASSQANGQSSASTALGVFATVVRPPIVSPVEGRSTSLTVRNVDGISVAVSGGTARQASHDTVVVTATGRDVVITLAY